MPAVAIEAKPAATMRVADLAVGGAGELVGIELEPGSSDLLTAMGLRAGCRVTMCRRGHSCVVRVCDGGGGGCRVGMSRELAAGLRVSPVTIEGAAAASDSDR
ncbi:MAG: FeoA domain-containing protein [Planctomycetota bacterium]